jgi:hypothetical protein
LLFRLDLLNTLFDLGDTLGDFLLLLLELLKRRFHCALGSPLAGSFARQG